MGHRMRAGPGSHLEQAENGDGRWGGDGHGRRGQQDVDSGQPQGWGDGDVKAIGSKVSAADRGMAVGSNEAWWLCWGEAVLKV